MRVGRRNSHETGVFTLTAELKTAYLRKIEPDVGPLTLVGWVQKPGRQLVFTEGAVRDANGRDLATATSTLIVQPVGHDQVVLAWAFGQTIVPEGAF
jgi:acyl-coenzyme A thioesterase PaaI-like protein